MATIRSTFLTLLITLTVITVVAGLSLGYVFQWTAEPIAEARLRRQLRAIDAVVSGYDNNPVEESFWVASPRAGDSLAFFPATVNGQPVGVAVKTRSSKGYSGDVWLMVGFDMDGRVLNVVVVEHQETPGLGSKMADKKFTDQFLGVDPGSDDLRVKKDGGKVDAITGATISSRAFSEAIQTAYDAFKSSAYGNNIKQ